MISFPSTERTMPLQICWQWCHRHRIHWHPTRWWRCTQICCCHRWSSLCCHRCFSLLFPILSHWCLQWEIMLFHSIRSRSLGCRLWNLPRKRLLARQEQVRTASNLDRNLFWECQTIVERYNVKLNTSFPTSVNDNQWFSRCLMI